MAFILLIFFLLLITLFLIWIYWVRSYNLNFVPSPLRFPLFGCALFLKSESNELFKQVRRFFSEFGSAFCLWIGPKPVLMTGNIDHIQTVLKSQKIITKSSSYTFLNEWLGTGLLTSTGAKWKSRRKVLTKAFHFSIINSYVDSFYQNSVSLNNHLENHSGVPINIQALMSLFTLDIICETAMGFKLNSMKNLNCDYVNAVEEVKILLIERQKSPWLWNKFVYKLFSSGKKFYSQLQILKSFTKKIVNKRIKSYSLSSNGCKSFLDLLIDAYSQGKIDLEGIYEEVDTFMFAGHDTTAAALSYIFLMLGTHPKVQKKLHEEIDTNANINSNENLSEKIRKMEYLDCVIKESLRLHPPVSVFGRILEEDTIFSNHLVGKGADIILCPETLHTDPLYWENHRSFIPERFSNVEFAFRQPYLYIPFSAGPRNCIGQKFALMEIKIAIFVVMSKFIVTAVEQSLCPMATFIQRYENGVLMLFEERKKGPSELFLKNSEKCSLEGVSALRKEELLGLKV
ncbi:cytochrome P450 4V2 isoform X3 [Hydra vulgaris]|uniref:Cytochrome P450 4V2 isoform X3 n=1 Tax=Hydra vulgaris TaxID=6087 RepID=A0ABM4B536_HYDVU